MIEFDTYFYWFLERISKEKQMIFCDFSLPFLSGAHRSMMNAAFVKCAENHVFYEVKWRFYLLMREARILKILTKWLQKLTKSLSNLKNNFFFRKYEKIIKKVTANWWKSFEIWCNVCRKSIESSLKGWRWLEDGWKTLLEGIWIALGRLPGATSRSKGTWRGALGPQNKRLKSLDNRYKLIEEGWRKKVNGLRRRWPKGPANWLRNIFMNTVQTIW